MFEIKLIIIFLFTTFASGTKDTDEKWKKECLSHLQTVNATLWRMVSDGDLPECFGAIIVPVLQENAGPDVFEKMEDHFRTLPEDEQDIWEGCWTEARRKVIEEVGEFPAICQELSGETQT